MTALQTATNARLLARKYLATQRCVLWSQSFDIITNPRQAEDWLTKLLVELVTLDELNAP